MEIGVLVGVTCSHVVSPNEWRLLAEELNKSAPSSERQNTALFQSIVEEMHPTTTASFYIATIGATKGWCAEQAVFLVTSGIGRVPSLRNDAYVSHIDIEE